MTVQVHGKIQLTKGAKITECHLDIFLRLGQLTLVCPDFGSFEM
jgi:hypothetical protein